MKILCIEGCSGTGKTTLSNLLYKYFLNKYNCLLVIEKKYEPFSSEVKKWYREKGPDVPFTIDDIHRFAKARAKTFYKNFSNLELDLLIFDRYYYTSAVYQSNDNITPIEIMKININYGSPIPDLTLLLDCDPVICFERINKRNKLTGGKPIFSTSPERISALRKKYLDLAKICNEIKIIDTNKPSYKVFEESLKKINEKIILDKK